MASNVAIMFETNASAVSKSIAEMTAEINKLKAASKGGATQSGRQTTETLGRAFRASNRPDLSRQSDLNAIRGASRRGLTSQLDASTTAAADMLKRTKGTGRLVAELNEGVGYAIDEGLRPLREASAALRKKAAGTKSEKSKQKYNDLADQIDAQVASYQKLLPGQKAAKRAFKEADSLAALEKAQSALQKIGFDIGSGADLTKYANRLSQISPAMAQSVKSLRDSMQKISPQEYMQRLADISMKGVSTLTQQKQAFSSQIDKTATGAAGKGGAYRKVFEQRFGNVEAMMTSGKQFEFKDVADQTAFSTWKDSVRKGMASYIQQQLDPKSIKQLTSLGEAKKTGDVEQIQKAADAADKAVKGRLSKAYEQLKKLEDIAKATKDRDLNNIVSGLKRQISSQGQVLNSQLADGAVKTQSAMYKSLDDSLKVFTNRANTIRGSKTTRTADNLGPYIDQLDNNVRDFISGYVANFKQLKFRSLGGKTMADAGVAPNDQNILNTKILGQAGFYKATTQTERLDALAKSTELVRPALEGVGLKGKELKDAEVRLTAVINQLASQYREAANQTQGVNARAAELQRAKALAAAKAGKFDEADRIAGSLGGFVNNGVNPRGGKGGTAGRQAMSEGELDPQAKADREQLREQLKGMREQAALKGQGQGGFLKTLRNISAFAGSLLNIYGAVSSAVGFVVDNVNKLIDKANQLDKVSSTVNALGGSFTNFNVAMQVATRQQAIYGGTLQETMQGLTSLMPLTKRYGADLGQLDNIARRLAVVDPLQGFQGAAIALKEFFSGDITSLSRRFEIDRKSLNSIKAAGSQLEQLQALDKALNDMGISNDVLAAKTQTAAISFDRAGASFDNFATMAGKNLQSTFKGTADDIAKYFAGSGRELATALEKEQFDIDITRQLSMIGAKFRNLGEDVKAVATEADKLTAGPFFDDDLLKPQIEDAGKLVKEFNDLIEKLNEVRKQEGKTMISYFSTKDADLIKQLADVAARTDIPIKLLLENMTPTGEQKSSAMAQTEAKNSMGFWDWLFNGEQKRKMNSIANSTRVVNPDTQETIRGTYTPLGVKQQDAAYANVLTIDRDNIRKNLENFSQNMQTASDVLRVKLLASTDTVSQLTDMQFAQQTQSLMEETGIDYVNAVKSYNKQLESGTLTQQEADAILAKRIELDKQLLNSRERLIGAEDDYITRTIASTQSFGTLNAKNNIIKTIDAETQRRAEFGQSTLARAYGEAGGGARNDKSNERVQQIIKSAKELFNIDRETLYYLDKTNNTMAGMALQADRVVSPFTMLLNLSSGLQTNIKDATQAAINFNKSIQSSAQSSLFSGLSLQSRLNMTMGNFNNIGGTSNYNPFATSLNNPEEIVNNANAAFSLLQENANKGLSYSKQIRDLTEKYEKDKAKIQDDGEKERTKIMEDWAETTAKLIRESEYEKRAATADFYEALFQNDNLTLEQQQQFSAQREDIRSEADAVRATDPAKAKLIMDAGEQKIRNEMDAAEKIAKYQKDNKDIDEEIGDLQKDLAKAKDAEEKKSIQKKIDKLNQQKLENQREIDQVIQVQNARRIADEQKLKDAREGISEEQKARDKAIQDSKDKEALALSDLQTQRLKDIEAAKSAAADASTAQIANETDLQQYQRVGFVAQQMASLAAGGASTKELNDFFTSQTGEIRKYFEGRDTPVSKVVLGVLDSLSKLPGSTFTGANPVFSQITQQDTLGLPPEVAAQVNRTFVADKGVKPPVKSPNLPTAVDTNTTSTDTNTVAIDKNTAQVKTFNDNVWWLKTQGPR